MSNAVQDWHEQLGPENVFSPMPPSEKLKTLVSTMVTGHDDGNQVDGLRTWDVLRVHYCCHARRWIHTYLLEGQEQVDKWARHCRSMCGTFDAASIWGDTWSNVLKESSMKFETANPAFSCSCDGDLKGFCHGDDFCRCTRKAVANLWKSP